MKKFFQIFFILITVIVVYFSLQYYQKTNTEDKLQTCIENILLNNKIKTISVETNNRGEFPLLTGSTSTEKKKKTLSDIKKSCHVKEIQDFIDTFNVETENQAFINFNIDAFNNIITIKGAFNNQKEFDDVLKSFNDAQPDKRIQHDVRIDSKVNQADFALDITLLLPTIESIHVADITIRDGKLILHGIVRDNATEKLTIKVLHQLFDDLIIVNQLQRVAESKAKINELKFEMPSIPKIKKPQQ